MDLMRFSEDNIVILTKYESIEIGNEIFSWCCECFTSKDWDAKYTVINNEAYPYQFWIKNETDLMMFKLRWI